MINRVNSVSVESLSSDVTLCKKANNDLDFTESESYFTADWPVKSRIKTLITTRIGGNSSGQYSDLNLADHVGDDLSKVTANRQKVEKAIHTKNAVFWLQQRHSDICVKYSTKALNPVADACYSECPDQPCVIMTADCLPILMANKQGSWVAACHAGWRGLAKGIIQKTVQNYLGEKSNLIAWLGPAISQKHFEVGSDVRRQFMSLSDSYGGFFETNQNRRFQFDFVGLAKHMLAGYGIESYGGNLCSFSDETRFFSYRRDGETGRMASFVWIDDKA